MKKLVGKTLDRETREERRVAALKQLAAGKSPSEVAKLISCHRSAVYQWIKRFIDGGINGLACRKITGAPSKLSAVQKKMVFDSIMTENLNSLHLPYGFWTLAAVRQHIADQYRVSLSEVSVSRLLNEYGLSIKKIIRNEKTWNMGDYSGWMKSSYPKIKKEAKKVGAKVYFCHIAKVHPRYCSDTSGTDKKSALNSQAIRSRKTLNVLVLVSVQGMVHFKCINERAKSSVAINILDDLANKTDCQIYLIVKDTPAFRSKMIQTFVTSTQGKLKIFEMVMELNLTGTGDIH